MRLLHVVIPVSQETRNVTSVIPALVFKTQISPNPPFCSQKCPRWYNQLHSHPTWGITLHFLESSSWLSIRHLKLNNTKSDLSSLSLPSHKKQPTQISIPLSLTAHIQSIVNAESIHLISTTTHHSLPPIPSLQSSCFCSLTAIQSLPKLSVVIILKHKLYQFKDFL